MTITKIASVHANTSTASTTLSLTVPSGVTTAHLGVLLVMTTGSSNQHSITVPGWTTRLHNPSAYSSEAAIFTRLGGVSAGNTVTATMPTTHTINMTAVWYNTGGNDVTIVGTAGIRSTTSTSTTIPGITTTAANQDVIVVAGEKSSTTGTTISGWSPGAPTQDYYGDASTSHFIGHFTKATAGATGSYTVSYNHSSNQALGLMLGVLPAADPAKPKIATFTSTFSTALDPAVWETFGSAATSNDRLVLPAAAAFTVATTWAAYDLTSSSVFLQVYAPSTDITSIKVSEDLSRYTGSNAITFEVNGNHLWTRVWTGGVVTSSDLGAYSVTTHGQFLRVRHVSGTTVAFDTSLDGSSWTQRDTKTVSWSMTKVVLGLSAGGSLGQTAYFDNLNTSPSAPTVTTAWSSEPSATSLSVGWTTANVFTARVVLSTSSSLTTAPIYSPIITPTSSGNITYRWTGLMTDTTYYVGIEVAGALSANGRGTYHTLKSLLTSSKVAAGSCNVTGSTHAVFTQIKTDAPDFFVHMGDIHYADTQTESTWRAALKSSLESSTIKSMLSTVTMPYDWAVHDAGGPGSDRNDPWVLFAPNAIRELTHQDQYADSSDVGLYRTWQHAGVRYIELDRMSGRSDAGTAESESKSLLGPVQLSWFLGLLSDAPESVIVVFDGFPHYSIPQTGDQWGSYATERQVIGDFIAALPTAQKNKIVFIGADSHAIHGDSGANAMWGVPNLCAGPLDQTPGGVAPGTWSIGDINATSTRGYYSRLTFAPGVTSTAVELRRNRAINPRATAYQTGVAPGFWNDRWTANTTYSLVTGATDGPVGITTFARGTVSTAGQSGLGFHLAGNPDLATPNQTGLVAVSPGETITVSCYIRSSRTASWRIGVRFANSTTLGDWLGPTTNGSTATVTSGAGWTRLSQAVTVPVNAQLMSVLVSDSGAAWSVSDTFDGTGLVIEKSTWVKPFFDGATVAYWWEGTANNSVSVESATGRRNLAPDPSFTATGSWTGTAATLAVDTAWSARGTGSLKVTSSATSTDSYAGQGGNTSFPLGMVAGKTYTISARGRIAGAFVGTLHARSRKLTVHYTTNSGGSFTDVESSAMSNLQGSARASVTVSIPGNATGAFVRLYNGSNNASDIIWWDALLVEETSSLNPYFDGAATPYTTSTTSAVTESATGRRSLLNSLHNIMDAGGGITKTTGVSFNGVTWTRLARASGATGSGNTRSYASLDDLEQGQVYTIGYLIYNEGTSSVSLPIDVEDTGGVTVIIPAGQTLRVGTTGTRTAHDATFRFADIDLPVNCSILVREEILERGSTTRKWFDSATLGNAGYPQTYGWTGTTNASPSIATQTRNSGMGLNMTWDAVRDDGTVVMTFTKGFAGSGIGATGFIKDPNYPLGVRPFHRHRNTAETTIVDGGSFSTTDFADVVDGGTPSETEFIDTPVDGGSI